MYVDASQELSLENALLKGLMVHLFPRDPLTTEVVSIGPTPMRKAMFLLASK